MLALGTLVNADDAPGSNELYTRFEVKRINHQEAYDLDGACTNWGGRIFQPHAARRHHHIAGAYLLRYVQEASWREDNRRMSNGEQVNLFAGLAVKRGKSVDFTAYWQRRVPSAG